MQDTNANTENVLNAGVSPLHSQAAPDGLVVDLPTIATIATIAVHNSPPWAGDIVANIPEEAGSASTVADAPAIDSGARSPQSRPGTAARSAPRPTVTLRECPLHTAMCHLAEAAVAQHVFYLEGEVRARPGLVNAVSRWERMHTLIRECVCPATREIAVGAAALTELVDQTLADVFTPEQQHPRTQFVQALETCAACTSAAECPMDTYPTPGTGS